MKPLLCDNLITKITTLVCLNYTLYEMIFTT